MEIGLENIEKKDISEIIPSYADMIDRVKQGDICDVILDTETTELSQQFAHPTSLSAVVADPFTKTVVHAHQRKVRIPEEAVMSTVASLITDRRPDTFEDGMRPDLAVAEYADLILNATEKVADFYDGFGDVVKKYNAGKPKEERIALPPRKDEIQYHHTSLRRTRQEREEGKKTTKTTRTAKDIVFVPTKNEAGQVIYNIAISKDGRQVYYKEPDAPAKAPWHRIENAKQTNIIQNARADNNWLWSWLFKSMYPHQFITHTKKHRGLLLDTLSLAREVNKLGPQGREKLILPERYDERLGQNVLTASKSAVVDANTRLANPRINIRPGITKPDGSWQDPHLVHDDLDDCLVTLGMYWYFQELAPELVKHKKEMSDPQALSSWLLEGEGAGVSPLISFVRSRYPSLSSHIGVTLNTDRAYGDFKRAVILNLNALEWHQHDPTNLYLKGEADRRNILDLSEDDWLELIVKEEREKPENGLFEILQLNKSPMVQPVETGMKAGANHGVPYQTLQNMQLQLGNMPQVHDKIMEAFSRYLERMKKRTPEVEPDPRPEDYRFNGVGTPPRYNFKGRYGPLDDKDAIERALQQRAKDMKDFYAKSNELLREIIRPDARFEIDPFDKETSPDPEGYVDYQSRVNNVLSRYRRLVRGQMLARGVSEKQIDKALKEFYKVEFESNEEANEFLWNMRKKILEEDLLVDLNTDYYHVVDKRTGAEIPLDRIRDIGIREFNDKIDILNGEWDVDFERLDYSRHFLATMFVTAGRLDDLSPEWQEKWYAARLAYSTHGAPFLGPDRQRKATVETEAQILERIRRGATSLDLKHLAHDPDVASVLHDDLIAGLSGKQKHLDELAHYLNEKDGLQPWTPEILAYGGYDPKTRVPLDRIPYPVLQASFEAATKYKLPDFAAENPIEGLDPKYGQRVFPVQETPALRKAWEKGDLSRTAHRIFKADGTGRHYLAPHSKLKRIIPGEDPSTGLLTKHSHRIFANAGVDFDPKAPFYLVDTEAMLPLATTRVVEPHFEIPVRGQHLFSSMLTPHLAGYFKNMSDMDTAKKPSQRKQLTGLAFPDYQYTEKRGYELKKGTPIRFLEIDDASGRETGWEVESELTSAPVRMTLNEFETKFDAGKITNDYARNYGFTDKIHMYREVTQWFTNLQKPKDSADNVIMLVRFKPASKKEGQVYCNRSQVARAAVVEKYYETKAGFSEGRQPDIG